AMDQGLPAEETLELASDASFATSDAALPESESPIALGVTSWNQALGRTYWTALRTRPGSQLARVLGEHVVSQSVALDRETSAIVDRGAEEKGWRVKREVRAENPKRAAVFRIFDFVIETRESSIWLETGVFSTAERLAARARSIASILRSREALAVFIVV